MKWVLTVNFTSYSRVGSELTLDYSDIEDNFITKPNILKYLL